MTQKKFLAEMRELLGNPSTGSVGDRSLNIHVQAALEWLARELKYSLREDEVSLELKADKQSYQLPPDANQIMWVRCGGIKLSPASTYAWDRDGLNWKNTTSGVPLEFAYEGREIIFDKAPSAAFIASYPRAQYKFVSSSPGITPGGIPKLPESDARLAVAYACIRWCIANPKAEGSTERKAGLSELLAMDLAEAKKRHASPIEDYQPAMGVATSRQGANR